MSELSNSIFIKSGLLDELNDDYYRVLRNDAALIADATLAADPDAGRGQAGVLRQIADAKIAAAEEVGEHSLAAEFRTNPDVASHVYDAIVQKPEAGEPLSPRWQIVDALNRAVGARVKEVGESIIALAVATGLRRAPGETEDYSRIDPEAAVWLDEGGANKTSVVRRSVTEKAMHALYGENLSNRVLYQLGGDRIIAPMVADPKTGEVKPNTEHSVVRGLAGEYMPERGALTEFDANLATALADGYEIRYEVNPWSMQTLPELLRDVVQLKPAVRKVIYLSHRDSSRPELRLVHPMSKGLQGGLAAIAELQDVTNKQFVIGTNGQYRSKDELQTRTFVEARKLTMLPAVALGDEEGDEHMFKGEILTTPARPASAYVAELAIYGRLSADYVSTLSQKESET